jgi:hypothetical protein
MGSHKKQRMRAHAGESWLLEGKKKRQINRDHAVAVLAGPIEQFHRLWVSCREGGVSTLRFAALFVEASCSEKKKNCGATPRRRKLWLSLRAAETSRCGGRKEFESRRADV